MYEPAIPFFYVQRKYALKNKFAKKVGRLQKKLGVCKKSWAFAKKLGVCKKSWAFAKKGWTFAN